MNATPWLNEQPLTADQISALLIHQFPLLSVTQVQRLSEGWDNVTWVINERWLFRFPKHANAAGLLKRELTLLPALASLPISVAQPRFIGRPSERYPYVFYGHALLSGEALDRCALNWEERGRLAVPLAQFLQALHAFPVTQAR